jgi:hypothetical protein
MIRTVRRDLDQDAESRLLGMWKRNELALYSHAGSTCELDLEIMALHSGRSPGLRRDAAGFLFALVRHGKRQGA